MKTKLVNGYWDYCIVHGVSESDMTEQLSLLGL